MLRVVTVRQVSVSDNLALSVVRSEVASKSMVVVVTVAVTVAVAVAVAV